MFNGVFFFLQFYLIEMHKMYKFLKTLNSNKSGDVSICPAPVPRRGGACGRVHGQPQPRGRVSQPGRGCVHHRERQRTGQQADGGEQDG